MRRKMLAEAMGTFALVFAGCGAMIADKAANGAVTHTGVGLTFGLVIMVMVYAFGHISGAHFNPAVTIGFAAAGRFPWPYVPHYLLAEFSGGIAATFLHWLIFNQKASVAQFGATRLSTGIGVPQGFVIEIILTIFLMTVIMAMATDKRAAPGASGLAIGMTVALCSISGGLFTGASMNPARSVAPALFAGGASLQQLWLYLLAPPVGAVLASRLYETLREKQFAKNVVSDLPLKSER